MEDSKLREQQEELSKVRKLLAEPGFELFRQEIQQQLQERLSSIILSPPEGLDDLIKKCYAIGECAGLKLAVQLPEIRKELLEIDIKHTRVEGENDGND